MDCSPPGSSVHGLSQARILWWVASPFSRGSPWSRDRTWVYHIAGRCFAIWATREDQAGLSPSFLCFHSPLAMAGAMSPSVTQSEKKRLHCCFLHVLDLKSIWPLAVMWQVFIKRKLVGSRPFQLGSKPWTLQQVGFGELLQEPVPDTLEEANLHRLSSLGPQCRGHPDYAKNKRGEPNPWATRFSRHLTGSCLAHGPWGKEAWHGWEPWRDPWCGHAVRDPRGVTPGKSWVEGNPPRRTYCTRQASWGCGPRGAYAGSGPLGSENRHCVASSRDGPWPHHGCTHALLLPRPRILSFLFNFLFCIGL